MKNHKTYQEFKGTARVMIYSINDSIGYIYITLHRKELENVFVKQTKNILKHKEQKRYKAVTEWDIKTIEGIGGLPGGKIENPSLEKGTATLKEQINTIEKEVQEEMGIKLHKNYELLDISRNQKRKKETNEYKKILKENSIINKEQIKKNKGSNNLANITYVKIPQDIEGLKKEGWGDKYDFNLNNQKKRNYINEYYHIAVDTSIDLRNLHATEKEALNEIGGYTKLPVHKIIYNNDGGITLETYNAEFSKVFKFHADRIAYHRIRIMDEIKYGIIKAIKDK